MIPVKLKLSNFTSYGENPPELDFTKFHMAAISGQNGVGKSSLLDSITWCLWGTSRAGDSADALVRLGQTSMLVEFSFQLDGHVYTVKRGRKSPGGGSTLLEFWSNSHNLTEGTIKSTQQKIIDSLHLTFDTFVNSAYIRQGHADEFTTKGPTERKKILADILGLSQYDQLEEKAKEKVKEIQTKIQLLEYQLLEVEAELALKDQREQEVSQAKQEAQSAEKELLEIERLIKQVDQERELIYTKYQSLQEKAQRLEAAKKEVLDLKVQVQIKQKAILEHQAILDQKDLIDQSCQKLESLNEQKESLEVKRSQLIKVKDELVEIQKILAEREDKRKSAISQLQIQIQKLQTENKGFQDQIDHLKSHKDTCPTCGQDIGEQDNKKIITKNQELIDKNSSELKELDQKVQKYQSIVLPEFKQAEQKESEIKTLETDTKEWGPINQQILSLQKFENLKLKLTQAQTAITAHTDAITDLEKILSERQKQVEIDQTDLELLETYKSQLQEVEQIQQAKLSLKQELSQKALQARGKLGAAESLLSKTSQLEKVKDQKNSDKAQLTQDKSIYEELSLAFGKKGIQAMIIETAIPEIETEANSLLSRLTDGRMQVRFETQRETKTKVSNGEKGLVETLDIIISDEMGERAYELYSGGEAFRVNLAIRLALSKLLTHRAGSKLQFLIIDEGFGTQDAQGLSRIVEALSVIKDDFEKILVITHLDELKEEFEVRIEVSKGAGGSTFELVGT